MAGIFAYTFFSPSVKNSVFATSLVRGRHWFLRNNLSVSPTGCHLSFQKRQESCGTPLASPERRGQTVKEPPISSSEIGGFSAKWRKSERKSVETEALPAPVCQLFQIHGSKLKPDPSCYGGQASVMRITHGVFLFCIRKDPFYRFLALCVNVFGTLCFSYLFRYVQILLPDMRRIYLLPILLCSAFCLMWAASALTRCTAVCPLPVTVRRCVPQYSSVRARVGILCRIVHIFPGLVFILAAFISCIRQYRYFPVIQRLLSRMLHDTCVLLHHTVRPMPRLHRKRSLQSHPSSV